MIVHILLLIVVLCGAEVTLDWKECKNDRGRYNCLCQKDGDAAALESIENTAAFTDDKIDKNCKIGVQMKAITSDIAIFHLQEKAEALGPTPELMLYHNDGKVFGCKFKDGIATLDVAEKFKDYVKLFEQRSKIDSEKIVCAIKVDKSSKLNADLQDAFTSMRLKPAGPEVIRTFYAAYRALFALKTKMRCNPYLFKDFTHLEEFYVKPVVDKDQDILNCDGHGISYKMRYLKAGQKDSTLIERIECRENNGVYNYVIVKSSEPSNLDETDVLNEESYTVLCASKVDEGCKDPRKCRDGDKVGDNVCPDYKKGSLGSPASYTCSGNKWFIDGQYMKLEKQPECKRDTFKNRNEVAFYTTLENGKQMRSEELNAMCFTNYDCKKHSHLYLPKCKTNDDLCSEVDDTKGVLECINPTTKLKIANETSEVARYTCDPLDGVWRNGSLSIEKKSKISCFGERPDAPIHEPMLSTPAIYAIIAAIFFALLLVFLGLGFFIIHLYRRKNKVSAKGKKAWTKLKKDERIEHCQKVFRHVINTKSSDSGNILDGLALIELLLDSETEHQQCWEEVRPFLMRFQGAMQRLDHSVMHMLSRYCYLQAKKIIEKHGWIATTPITSKNENGLMRVVAIQLLSFAISDPFNIEAEEMVREGFKNLKFKAISQYPHCGVLWSVLMYARPLIFNPKKCETNLQKSKRFSTRKMENFLIDIAYYSKIQMPEEDIIPEFGSIAKQAAYALGAVHDHTFLHKNKHVLTSVEHADAVGMSTSFFRGMCDSLYHNPSQTVIETCKWPKGEGDFLADMYKRAPEAEWSAIVRQTNKLVVYYGKHLDAMRLSSGFMKNEKQNDAEIAEMKTDQEEFEAALEDQLNEIRKWFAARTDKEEFKKKPVYITDHNGLKLDCHISADGATKKAQGGTQSNSKSSSAIKTAEGNSNPSSSSSPKDGAAAAAKPTPNAAEAAPVAPPPDPAAAPKS